MQYMTKDRSSEVLNIENNPKIYRYNATRDKPNVTETYCSTIPSNPEFFIQIILFFVLNYADIFSTRSITTTHSVTT